MKNRFNNKGFAHIALIVVVVVLGIISLVGLIVYQNKTDKNYSSKIQPTYAAQVALMNKLYSSFSLPVFASNNSDTNSDSKDLATIKQGISQANQSTNKLKTTNNIVVLPLITSRKVKAQHKAIVQYVNDSTAFLQQYQELDSYTKGLDDVLNKSTKAADAFAQLQSATSLQNVKDQLNNNPSINFLEPAEELQQLTPPKDLKNIHEKLLNALNGLQNDTATLQLDINSCNSQSLAGDCQSLINDIIKISGPDSSAFFTLANYDLAGNLQHNSWLHTQILKLRSEKPLSQG